MEIFKGENIVDFVDRFSSDKVCQQYLHDLKWSEGYTCRKCGHKKHTSKNGTSMVCTKCFHIESPTANTLFHKVKFGLRKAFMIVFEMSATTKGISASQITKRYGISQKTAWFFMHKVRTAMKSSGNFPMSGTVHVDEFVVGGKENLKPGRSTDVKKKKIVCAVELGDDNKIKRVYSMSIKDYSSVSLRTIFEKHISKDANVITDEWLGYRPISKDYDITQLPSNMGQNFKQLHIVIHQIKSWIRTTYSWTHKQHTDKYLDEYSFRINRSIFKDTIFHKLIGRMVSSENIEYKGIIACS